MRNQDSQCDAIWCKMRRVKHRHVWFALVFGAGFVLAAGCGDDETSTADEPNGCARYAEVYCTDVASCVPSIGNQITDRASCEQRVSELCDALLLLDDVAVASGDVATCAEGFAQAACSGQSSTLFESCATLMNGGREDGQTCASPLQCAGGFCKLDDAGTCGTCETVPGVNEACSGRCEFGLQCGPEQRCIPVVLVGAGEACDFDSARFCDTGLHCAEEICVANVAAGESCDGAQCQQGTFCDSANTICQPNPPLAAAGAACGFNTGVSTFVDCEAGAYCQQDVCVASVPDGGACERSGACTFPANCVDGTCRLDHATCE